MNHEDGCQDDPHEKIKHTLDEAENIGAELISYGRKLTAAGQEMLDWARVTLAAVDYLPSGTVLDNIGSSWEYSVGRVNGVVQDLSAIDISVLETSTGMSAYSSVTSLGFDLWVDTENPDEVAARRQATEQILDLASRPHHKTEAIALLKQFGMDRAQGNSVSPLEHFETAHAAFENTVQSYNSAITSLIPMRSCVEGILAQLLRRRPHQEPAGKPAEKILSIGGQCAHGSISAEDLEQLANRCTDLLDKRLSSSKDKAFTRTGWQSTLAAATIWVESFLHSIDPDKLGS